VHMLHSEQKDIVALVMKTLHDFLYMEDLTKFKPLRLVINGQGGSGKSVVIKTIVTLMRKMLNDNDVVKVVAPTGVAASNAGGETFHHMLKMNVSTTEYIANNSTSKKRKDLIKKFKVFLALIVDERSLVPLKLLGEAEQMISESVLGGHFSTDSWGGLPIVILVGDDYQLPGIGFGPLHVMLPAYGSKMTQNGRKALLECSECVMDLNGCIRVKNSEIKTKALMNRVREGKLLPEEDIDKLMSLDIKTVERKHGKTLADSIRKDAVYLFYRNDPRIQHNLKRLSEICSPDNPVAIMKARGSNPNTGKAYTSHFNNDIPSCSLLCKGCMVSIEGRNFNPEWGLHNGASGIVQEIIFEKGGNPNHGNLPAYVVVDLPLYTGPTWDKDNPTVRHISDCIILSLSFRIKFKFSLHYC